MGAPIGDHDEDGVLVWADNLLGSSGAAHSVSNFARGEDSVRALRRGVEEGICGRIPVPQRRGPRV